MKLGITYMVFDGEELLEFAVKSIRNQVDHIAVTFQSVSYFGNPASPELFSTLERLKFLGLIDELIYFEPDLSLHHKQNELNLRNIGLEASRKACCTHHISADVDEFYKDSQLEYAKNAMEDYDFCMAPYSVYYKEPTFLVYPEQKLFITLIHPVSNEYYMGEFPFRMELTRRLKKFDKYKIFTKEEICVHHMSYVRKDLKKKFDNSDNARYYHKLDKFIHDWDNYKLGDRVCLIPDFKNRKTIQVENYFNISF